MRKIILFSFIVLTFLFSFFPLYTQTSSASPKIIIKGNNLARYGQDFLIHCLLNHDNHENIEVLVKFLDSDKKTVTGLTPIWGENLFLDSLFLKTEKPFSLKRGRSLFSFEIIAPVDTLNYTVRVIAFSKSESNPSMISWIDSTDYVVNTSRLNLPVVYVDNSKRDDFYLAYFGNINEEITRTLNNVIQNNYELDAIISKVEIFGINGTSDAVFTLVSPKSDSSFLLPSREKIPLTIRFKPDTLKFEPFSAVVFVTTENTIEKINAFTIDGYFDAFNPSVNDKFSEFQITPNPVQSTAEITIPTTYELGSENELNILVNDLQGNLVFSKNITPINLKQNISFIPNISGTYSVSIQRNNEILSTKIFQVVK